MYMNSIKYMNGSLDFVLKPVVLLFTLLCPTVSSFHPRQRRHYFNFLHFLSTGNPPCNLFFLLEQQLLFPI